MIKRFLGLAFGLVILLGGITTIEANAQITEDCKGVKDAVVYDADPTLCEYYNKKCCVIAPSGGGGIQ